MQITQDDIVVLAVTIARHTVTIEQLIRENAMLKEHIIELKSKIDDTQVADCNRRD